MQVLLAVQVPPSPQFVFDVHRTHCMFAVLQYGLVPPH
jgi:hypothetical protein